MEGEVDINLVDGHADVWRLLDEAAIMRNERAALSRPDWRFEWPPEPGFARREAHYDRDIRSKRRVGGS